MYRVADRLVVKAGRMVRQAGTEWQKQARSKLGGQRKKENSKKQEFGEKRWLT